MGTHAVGDFLKNGGYRSLAKEEASDDLVAVVPVHYSEYDPLEPKFELGSPVFIRGH